MSICVIFLQRAISIDNINDDEGDYDRDNDMMLMTMTKTMTKYQMSVSFVLEYNETWIGF